MRIWVAVGTAVLVAPFATMGHLTWAEGEAASVSVHVWELPRGAGVTRSALDARKGWRRVSPDAGATGPFAGGVAMENRWLLALAPAGGDGVCLFSKGKGKARYVRQDLILVDDGGREAMGLGQLRLVEHDQTEAVLRLTAGRVEAKLKLGVGPFVEVAPGRNAGALKVRGTARFAFIPDFFGNDVLYDAREVRSPRAFAPTENFLVSLIDGHAALAMLTWPKGGGEEVFLVSEGEGAGRRFAATQIRFSGKSVFVALIAREGIWHAADLTAAEKDKTFVVSGWRPPFPAKWMTILARRPALGATSGLASETLAVRKLPPKGDTPYSDVYVHPWAPSWFSDGQWRIHLQTTLTHMMTREKIRVPEFLVAVNYPRDRVKETPIDAFTLVDVMRGTLGAGPCKYILDLEGLNKTRSTGAAGTGKPTAAATCSERGALVYYYLGERMEAPRRDDTLMVTDSALESVEKIKDFLDAAHARIQEYLTWSDEIVKLAEEAKATDPSTRDLADRVIAIASEMRQLWSKMAEHGKPCAFPAEWRLALDHCKELIRRGAPDLGARIRAFDPQMRTAGEEVDGGMQACRRIVKRVRQEAALAGSADPKALRLAATIRESCRRVLRNKHYKEGDSVRLSGGRGAR